MRRALIAGVGVVAAGTAVLQLARPVATNPPVEPSMRLEAQARVPPPVAATLRRACYDCHSNETRWPWYAHVGPSAWLVVRDVDEGRGHLNFSRWGAYHTLERADLLDEACRQVRQGAMPRRPYLLLHRDARLSSRDRDALCAWTDAEAARLTRGATAGEAAAGVEADPEADRAPGGDGVSTTRTP